jgi:hypothetical protein
MLLTLPHVSGGRKQRGRQGRCCNWDEDLFTVRRSRCVGYHINILWSILSLRYVGTQLSVYSAPSTGRRNTDGYLRDKQSTQCNVAEHSNLHKNGLVHIVVTLAVVWAREYILTPVL